MNKCGRWMERKKRVVPGEICTERPEKGKRDHRKKIALNVQKSAEAICTGNGKGRINKGQSTLRKEDNAMKAESTGK